MCYTQNFINMHVTVNQKETPDTKHQPRYILKL